SNRAAVGRPVLVLWGIFWTAYLVILGFALVQSQRVARTRALVWTAAALCAAGAAGVATVLLVRKNRRSRKGES
ncbi:MAG: hypothetical protein IJJ43_04025, partial [Oscillospiraceae bacterium]|nr:hypothetical protein [Oscillospiraceae bacterium]